MNKFDLQQLIAEFLEKYGVQSSIAEPLGTLITFALLLVVSWILFKVSRTVIRAIFKKIIRTTKNQFDDKLLKNKFPKFVSYFVPLLFLYYLVPNLNWSTEFFSVLLQRVTDILLILTGLYTVRSLLRSISDHLRTLPSFKDKPLDSYLQVVMIIMWLFGIIALFSVLTGKNVNALIAALGAISAVLLFVFKDTILGFVASVQITVNDTVRIGDWITMKNQYADGDVIKITLSSVIVQNFDKTYTSIPTYKLVSDSFVNWRGMEESSGRRIKRSILIKVSSVKFLTDKDVKNLRNLHLFGEFIENRQKEVAAYNQKLGIPTDDLINGRNLTNIGTFRYYIQYYLKSRRDVNQKMTLMCRQLAQTPKGIPIEVYAFSSDKIWVNYESIMSDLFDHIYASVKYFDLECYEDSFTH